MRKHGIPYAGLGYSEMKEDFETMCVKPVELKIEAS